MRSSGGGYAMAHEIWVWAEHLNNELRESSLEMLGEARKLADKMGCTVSAFLIGDSASKFTDSVISYGADLVYVFENEGLKDFSIEKYLYLFSSKKKESKVYMIFIAATPDGSALALRLAARFQCGYVANTVTTAMQPDLSIKSTVPVYLGKGHCVLRFEASETLVISMKPGSVGITGENKTRKGEIEICDATSLPESKTIIKGYIKADPNTVSMDETEDVAAAGSGFRTQADIELLKPIADSIGAVVGGSKPMMDKGWIPRSRLIGQSSGRRISPRLCLCTGISGSNQFIEGMKDSRNIIVINKDKGAPLVKLADMALIGDLYEILPEIERELKSRQATTYQK